MNRLFIAATCLAAACAHAPPPEPAAQRDVAVDPAVECRPNPHLAAAKEAFDELRYDDAAQLLQRAIEHERNCKSDLVEIYRLRGYIDGINGESERCVRDFEIVRSLDVSYALPADAPPKIRACFDRTGA